MAVPAAEAMSAVQDDVARGVLRKFAEVSPIIRWIKYRKTSGITLERAIDDVLPTPFYAGINYDIVAGDYVHGTSRLAKDTVARLLVPVRIDEIFKETRDKYEDEWSRQLRMGSEAAAEKFDNDFWLGQGGLVTLGEPIGMYRRLSDGITAGSIPSNQRIDCGGPLTMSKLDRLCDAVPTTPGSTTVLFMNANMRRKVTALMRDPSYRGLGSITYDKDEFGMQVEMYNGRRIAVVENLANYNSALSFTETTTGLPTLGTGVTGTGSIWAVNFGDERGVYAFGPRDMGFTMKPPVRIEGQVYDASISTWLYAYVTDGPRDIARLYGISYEADSD